MTIIVMMKIEMVEYGCDGEIDKHCEVDGYYKDVDKH